MQRRQATIGSRRILVAIGGYIAASLAIPLTGVVLGLAFTVIAAVPVVITGLAKGDFVPTDLSVATLPLYFSFLGVLWSAPAMPGVLAALPFIVFGEIKRIRTGAYYVLVGALAAAGGRAVLAYVLGHWDQVFQTSGVMLIPSALFGMIAGAIYWRFVGRNAGGQTAASA